MVCVCVLRWTRNWSGVYFLPLPQWRKAPVDPCDTVKAESVKSKIMDGARGYLHYIPSTRS